MNLVVLVIVLALDQISKSLVVSHLQPGEVQAGIPELVYWTFVKNRHAAYGLFSDNAAFLVTLSAVVLVLLWLALRQQLATSLPTRIAYSAIFGGAIGNIIDRFHYGFVVDFISVKPMPFFEVFNVADSAISLGMVALLIISFIERPAPRNAP